jgi:hypothetical protein
MLSRGGVLVVACVAANIFFAAAAQPTFVSVVDDNGLMTPIAVFDGATWWNRWPMELESDAIRTMPVPKSLALIPADWLPPGLVLPREWRVLRESGSVARIRALRIRRPPEPAMMDTFVIQTTEPRRADGAEESVAISGPGTLGRFVAPGPDEGQHVLEQVAARIDSLELGETARWKRESETYRNVVLTRVYRVTTPKRTDYVTQRPRDTKDFGLVKAARQIQGRTFYHLDGEKLFRMQAEGECMLNLSSSGVLATNAQGVVVSERIASTAWAEYCGDRAESATLLATLQIRDRVLWVMKTSLEDGYDYVFVNPVSGESVQPRTQK